jgi:DNA end-binding protein Ku
VVLDGNRYRGFAEGDSGDPEGMPRLSKQPRSLWTGSISFGLVNVPVRVYSAVHEHKLRFQLIHTKDDAPIGYENICTLEDKPLPNDENVKSYESRKGDNVQMTD